MIFEDRVTGVVFDCAVVFNTTVPNLIRFFDFNKSMMTIINMIKQMTKATVRHIAEIIAGLHSVLPIKILSRPDWQHVLGIIKP